MYLLITVKFNLCFNYLVLTILISAVRFGDDWKKCLELPPKDNRVKTSVR